MKGEKWLKTIKVNDQNPELKLHLGLYTIFS